MWSGVKSDIIKWPDVHNIKSSYTMWKVKSGNKSDANKLIIH